MTRTTPAPTPRKKTPKKKTFSSDSEAEEEIGETKGSDPPEKPQPTQKRKKSEPAKKSSKGRAPVSTKNHDRVFQGVFPEKQKKEAEERWAKAIELDALPAKKDMRDITLEMAYKVAFELLTLDGNEGNTLVHNGVYIDRSKFKKAVVSKASAKLVPYDAAEYGVEAGIKVVIGRVEWTVKSTQHGDVVVEAEGRLVLEREVP